MKTHILTNQSLESLEIFRNSEALVDHIVQVHTSNPQQERYVFSNGVWGCLFCGVVFQGNEARDTHICNQHTFQTVQQQEHRRNKSKETCKRGDQCHHFRLGKCWYYHVLSVESKTRAQGQRGNTERNDMTRTTPQGEGERTI